MEPVEARVIERDGLRLVVDPVAQAAIDAARAAGINSPASTGGLPDMDELPLLFVTLQVRVELIEARLDRLEIRDRLRRTYDPSEIL